MTPRRLGLLAAIWAVLAGLLVAAGEIVTHSATITNFDFDATRAAVGARTAALDTAMKIVTWLGSWVALTVMAAVVILLVATKRLRALAAILVLVAWAGESAGVRIAKETVARSRPARELWLVSASGWSFPSGHAATASLACGVLALCAAVLTRRKTVRILAWLAAGLAIAATAFSRVELGVHWTTDVLASLVFVPCWLTAIWLALGGGLSLSSPQPRGNHRGRRLSARGGADGAIDSDR